MKRLLLIAAVLFALPARAQHVETVTLEGGPIWSKHFQSGDPDFNEEHGLAILKLETDSWGDWGVYYLSPNSVDDPSVGFGYIFDPYVIPLGPTELELSAGLGLVTGYQDYPVPLIAGQARLSLYKQGRWNVGITAAALPYYMEDLAEDKNRFGIVATTPFLSVRYKLNDY